MQKEILSTSRDEATKITRVNYADGTFDALTDEEVKELDFDEVAVEDVDADAATEETITDESTDTDPDDVELGQYKLLVPIPYTDETGEPVGEAEVGSVQTVPVELGEHWVAEGMAEKVVNDNPQENG